LGSEGGSFLIKLAIGVEEELHIVLFISSFEGYGGYGLCATLELFIMAIAKRSVKSYSSQ
jgi:hypothetical protein